MGLPLKEGKVLLPIFFLSSCCLELRHEAAISALETEEKREKRNKVEGAVSLMLWEVPSQP